MGQLRGYLPQHRPDLVRSAGRSSSMARRSDHSTARRPLTPAGDVMLLPPRATRRPHVRRGSQDGAHRRARRRCSYTQELMLEGAVDGVCPDEQVGPRHAGTRFATWPPPSRPSTCLPTIRARWNGCAAWRALDRPPHRLASGGGAGALARPLVARAGAAQGDRAGDHRASRSTRSRRASSTCSRPGPR